MTPSNISPGSAATVLSFLALAGLQLETRFRVGEVLAAPSPELSDEPEPELPLGQQLEGRLGRLEKTVAGQGALLAELGVRTARCEALLEPLEESKPGQSAESTMNLTSRSIGNSTTINTTADGLARTKLRWGSVPNPVGLDLIEQVQQMQIDIDDIKKVTQGSRAPYAGHGEMQRRRVQANGGGAGAEDANGAASTVSCTAVVLELRGRGGRGDTGAAGRPSASGEVTAVTSQRPRGRDLSGAATWRPWRGPRM